jgi:nucleoside-diphosphate-sugar epimerase
MSPSRGLNRRHALLTGGSGLIGWDVLVSLKRRGWTVTSMDIRESSAVSELADRSVVGDFCDLTVADLFGYDAVIHLAAMLEPAGSLAASGTVESPEMILQRADRMIAVNVVGNQRLFSAACEAGVPAVVYASTIGVYGAPSVHAHLGDAEVPSTGPFAPFALYSYTKVMDEGLAHFYARSFGTRFIGLRPTFAYGIGRLTGMAGMFAQWIVDAAAQRRALLDSPFGIDSRFQTFYVKDMADAFVDAADVAIDGSGFPDGRRSLTLNTPTEEYLSIGEMLPIIQEVTGNRDVHVTEKTGNPNVRSPRINSADAIRILGTKQRYPFPEAVADIVREARAIGLA